MPMHLGCVPPPRPRSTDNSLNSSPKRWRPRLSALSFGVRPGQLSNGALAAGSFAALLVLPRSQRPQLIIGGIAAALSTPLMWFLPLDVEDDAELAERLSSLPEPE